MKRFLCLVCSKTFSLQTDLTAHERTHSTETQHKCNVCYKAFASDKKWKIHARMSCGENLFECKICSKAFRWRGNLNKHERTHTKEKLHVYKCQLCHAAFPCNNDLCSHYEIHNDKYPLSRHLPKQGRKQRDSACSSPKRFDLVGENESSFFGKKLPTTEIKSHRNDTKPCGGEIQASGDQLTILLVVMESTCISLLDVTVVDSVMKHLKWNQNLWTMLTITTVLILRRKHFLKYLIILSSDSFLANRKLNNCKVQRS